MKRMIIALLIFNTNLLFAQQATILASKGNIGIFKPIDSSKINIGEQYILYRQYDSDTVKVGIVNILKIMDGGVSIKLTHKISKDNIEIGDIIDLSNRLKEENTLSYLLSEASSTVPKTTSTKNAKNKLETWYTLWGLGYSNISYPKEWEDILNNVEDDPRVEKASIAIDMLGFYWPKNEQTLFGGIINGFADRYELDQEHIQINNYIYSFSVIHFLNNRIGQGPFFRGDIGASRIVVQMSDYETEASTWGVGGLLGLGVGIPITQGTRILFSATYTFRKIDIDTYESLQFIISGLF